MFEKFEKFCNCRIRVHVRIVFQTFFKQLCLCEQSHNNGHSNRQSSHRTGAQSERCSDNVDVEPWRLMSLPELLLVVGASGVSVEIAGVSGGSSEM